VVEELRAFELLHPELAEVEEHVADVGHLLGVAADHLECKLLCRIVGVRVHASRNPSVRRIFAPLSIVARCMCPSIRHCESAGRIVCEANATSAVPQRQDRPRALVWLWFRSPLFEAPKKMMRPSNPPH